MPNLLDALARHVFVPAYHHRWGIRNPALRTQLLESQYLDQDTIVARQFLSLQSLLAYVYSSNRFYRLRFDSLGARPSDIRTWQDFEALPLLTKDDIRTNGPALLSDGVPAARLRPKRTGGSTGVPLRLYWDKEAISLKHAIVERHDAWTGYRPGDRRAALWGDTHKKYSWKEHVHKLLAERTIYLDTLKMSDKEMSVFVEKCRRFKPRSLIGHAHSLYFFSRFLRDRQIDDLSFDGIISTAETLSRAERLYIEQTFGKVLFNRYGCEEVSLIASECEAHHGLHISAEALIVELLSGDGEATGRVVVTDLSNRAMPLIRYEVGDLATWLPGRCECGRGLPRLAAVHGRTSDILYTPEGVRISGISILDTFVIHLAGIRQAQIIQDRLDHVLFKIVRERDFSQTTFRAIERAVGNIFGANMMFSVEFVDEIPRTPRGKYQFSVCQIKTRL